MIEDDAERAIEAFRAVRHTLRTHVSCRLISDSCWDLIHELTDEMPFDSVAQFGLEMHVSSSDPFAEPNVRLHPGTLLAKHCCTGKIPQVHGGAAISEYLGSGNDADVFRPTRKRFVDLEFDWDQLQSTESPIPGVFMIESFSEPVEKIAGLIARTGHREANERELAKLQRVLDAFQAAPDECFQIGFMASRRPATFRLVSQPLLPSAIPDFLERVGWPGQVGSVVETLNGLGQLPLLARAAPDITEQGVTGRLGVELMVPRFELGCRGWEPLVAKLESEGLCLPEKAMGLLAWPKTEIVFWDSSCIRLYSGFSHFKILFDTARDGSTSAMQAKAYSVTRYFTANSDSVRPTRGDEPAGIR